MKDLLSMFGGGGGNAKKDSQPAFKTKRTVIEEGNVAPGSSFKPKAQAQPVVSKQRNTTTGLMTIPGGLGDIG